MREGQWDPGSYLSIRGCERTSLDEDLHDGLIIWDVDLKRGLLRCEASCG